MKLPLTIWQFTDGKPGHESQTRGLIAAMARPQARDSRPPEASGWPWEAPRVARRGFLLASGTAVQRVSAPVLWKFRAKWLVRA